MVRGVYAFRDNKTVFGQLWMDHNDEAAKRGFALMMQNSDGIMGFAPSDFDLFKIGEYDTESGKLTPVWPIEFLMNGVNAVRLEVLAKEGDANA